MTSTGFVTEQTPYVAALGEVAALDQQIAQLSAARARHVSEARRQLLAQAPQDMSPGGPAWSPDRVARVGFVTELAAFTLRTEYKTGVIVPRRRFSRLQVHTRHASRLTRLLGGRRSRGPPGETPPRKAAQMVNNNNVQALHDYNTRIKAAFDFADPNWTNSAITRERIKRVAAARAELRAAIPAPTVSENTGELR
jgi:hypothetical protein